MLRTLISILVTMALATIGAYAKPGTKPASALSKKSNKADKPTPGVSAESILQKADDARMPDGTISFYVRVEDRNGTEVLGDTTYHVWAKGEAQAMIETTLPARLKGRKLLMKGDDLWLYLPSVKRPTRVGLQQRLTGEVANGDIARTRFHADYKPKIVGTETLSGRSCHKLELRAKKKETTYRRVLLWVETSSGQPVKAEFFALSGKLLKRSEYFDYKNILGGNRATRVLIRDAIKPSRMSELFYSDFQREELDDSFFTKESLM
jgi:outer membrane lipoprotein-sorting protein